MGQKLAAVGKYTENSEPEFIETFTKGNWFSKKIFSSWSKLWEIFDSFPSTPLFQIRSVDQFFVWFLIWQKMIYSSLLLGMATEHLKAKDVRFVYIFIYFSIDCSVDRVLG